MLQGVPRKVLPAGQNKYPTLEDIQFLADGDGIHPRSLGKAAGIHLGLSPPQHGRVDRPTKLLQWANDDIKTQY